MFAFYELNLMTGKKRVMWLRVLAVALVTYGLVIGGVEVVWYCLTGNPGLLIGGFALVAATLINVRVIGTSLCDPLPRSVASK